MSVEQISLSATLVVTGVGLNILFGSSHRVLHATRRNVEIIVVTGGMPVLALFYTLVIRASGLPSGFYALNITLAMLSSTLILTTRALRHYPGSMWADAVGGDVTRSHFRSVLQVGIPSVVSSAALVVAFQSDRLVISHLSSSSELTRYALLTPLVFALLAIVRPLALNLWPKYRVMLVNGEASVRDVRRDCLVFLFLGLSFGAALVIFGPPVVSLMSSGEVSVTRGFCLLFAGLIAVQFALMPLEALLTDRLGFRVQAVAAVAMAAVNLMLSVALVPLVGAAGAVLGSTVSVLSVQAPLLAAEARKTIRRSSQSTLTAPGSGRRL